MFKNIAKGILTGLAQFLAGLALLFFLLNKQVIEPETPSDDAPSEVSSEADQEE